MLRTLLEQSTRNLVFKRSLPPQVGGQRMFVSPSSGLRYLLKPLAECDPVLLSNAAEFVKPGATVWDVGANVGLFSFAAAGLAGKGGRVYAFEPDAWCIQLLRRSANLQAPTRAPVCPIAAALSDSCSLREFQLATRSRSSNALAGHGQSQTGGFRELQTVVALSLDWLLGFLPAPHVLKIDVEGAELKVLQGARTLLEQHRPVVICEVSPEQSPEVSELFHSHGYTLENAELPPAQRRPLELASWNSIALPPKQAAPACATL
jgi:FkbM family methyltransferase